MAVQGPPRLLDDSTELSDEARAALAEYRRLPDATRIRRVAAGLTAVGISVSAGTAAAKAGSALSAGSLAALAKLAGPALAVGLVVGAGVGVAVVQDAEPGRTVLVAPPSGAPTASAAAEPRSLPSVEVSELEAPASSAGPVLRPPFTQPPIGLSPPAPAPKPPKESETALLLQARRAQPAEALRLCDEHRARFGSGGLAQEREMIAIEALLRLGRRDDARARAASFLQQFPGSPHRQRLESLLGAERN